MFVQIETTCFGRIKFGFFEKATKFDKIFVVLLTRALCSVRATAYLLVKKSMKIVFLKMWTSRIIQTLKKESWKKVNEITLLDFSLLS